MCIHTPTGNSRKARLYATRDAALNKQSQPTTTRYHHTSTTNLPFLMQCLFSRHLLHASFMTHYCSGSPPIAQPLALHLAFRCFSHMMFLTRERFLTLTIMDHRASTSCSGNLLSCCSRLGSSHFAFMPHKLPVLTLRESEFGPVH